MITDVKAPVLAESVPDATLLEWKKQAGESVEANELLVEVETDKVVLEVVAPASGVLKEIVKGNGETIVSGDLIGRIDSEGAATAEAKAEPDESAAETSDGDDDADGDGEGEAKSKGGDGDAESKSKGGKDDKPATGSADLSPAVRKLVEENDLDPSAISGTGRGGRLTKGDVLEHLEKQPAAGASKPPEPEAAPKKPAKQAAKPSPAPAAGGERGERREPMSRLRQRIAERLVSAQQNAALLTTFNEVNMGPLLAMRTRYKEAFEKKHGVRLGFMSFFAKASVQALQRFPAVNAYIEGTEIVYHDYYDIGVAVGSPRGLVVPVLRDVDRSSFADIEQQIAEFGKRAQDGSLTMDEMTGGTFTISNGGVFGSLLSTPILNPPQSGILGMHKTQDRPMAENGEVVIRQMMYLALSYDHRIVDGREAVQFLVTIKEAIEDPSRMLLDV